MASEEMKQEIREALISERFLDIARNAKSKDTIEDVLQQEINRRKIDATVFGIVAVPEGLGGGYEAQIDLKDNRPVERFKFEMD